ncbi:MAG: diphosphomevalonate decarboxylase [Proteobacteria bacterium]|nr:diphosphomevalonate decarboxylase [Pseudomonadota bacterium]
MTENTREFRATARATANIAIAKYWGKRDENLNLPLCDSVAFNVAELTTETTAVWDEDDFRDALVINNWQVPSHKLGRIQRILDAIREQSGLTKRCILHSKNNFPLSSGLASSASGCAAAAMAASKAAGLSLSEKQLSALARLGSGSAARSIPAGWTLWHAGNEPDGSDSFAESIAPASHWPLHCFIIRVDDAPKTVSSTDAMLRCQSSPFWDAYQKEAADAADAAKSAVIQRDFAALTKSMHHNMMMLHALNMSCEPPICYFAPKSIELIQHILRACQAIQVCCTLDAGANVIVAGSAIFASDIAANTRAFLKIMEAV